MKTESGLVFAIPLDDKSFGFGQLISWQNPIFYMVGYDLKSESPEADEKAIVRAHPVLMGNFFDVLIRNGRWSTLGKMQIPDVPFPCFKIKIGEQFYVESWDRKQKREATSRECTILPFRTDNSAIILENALNAHFGLKPWESKWFDPLKADTVATLSKMI